MVSEYFLGMSNLFQLALLALLCINYQVLSAFRSLLALRSPKYFSSVRLEEAYALLVFTHNRIMTELLQQAIAQIQKLPPDQQDAIAARFLAELQDEQKWETRFAATTDDQWDRMADMVRQEIAAGETVPLDEVFPTHK